MSRASFTPRSLTPVKEIEQYDITAHEIKLIVLDIMGYIWNQSVIWGDTHSTEMNKNSVDSGLNFICKTINTPGAPGKIGAYQTLCLVSMSGALIREFAAKGVLQTILLTLHSGDPELRLYSAEILKNFTKYGKVTDYVDTLDLLRNMIDAFYSTDDLKLTNLLLESFLNLSE